MCKHFTERLLKCQGLFPDRCPAPHYKGRPAVAVPAPSCCDRLGILAAARALSSTGPKLDILTVVSCSVNSAAQAPQHSARMSKGSRKISFPCVIP